MPEIISRDDAIAQGLKFFCTGIPCRNGHISSRQVANYDCHECAKARWLENHKISREARLRRMAEYYQNNKARLNAANSARMQLNPEMNRANVSRARARKLAAEGSFEKSDIVNILKMQKGKCAECRCNLRAYHIDHIAPLSKGGSNWPRNIQCLCISCNTSKSNKTPTQLAKEKGRLL